MDCLAYEKEEQAHMHYWQKHVARAPKEIPQGIPPTIIEFAQNREG